MKLNLVRRYSALLDRRPMITRLCTGAFLCFTGDVMTQILVEGRSLLAHFNPSASPETKFDTMRTKRACLVGFTAISLNLYAWYSKLLPLIVRTLSATRFFKAYPTAITTFIGNYLHFLVDWGTRWGTA